MMDVEITAVAAAAAMATIIVKPENYARTLVSFALRCRYCNEISSKLAWMVASFGIRR